MLHQPVQKLSSEKKYFPPLFERLTQEGTVMLREDEVKASIQRNLTQLFNVRYDLEPYLSTLAVSPQDQLDLPAPLAYGVPNFSSRKANDPQVLCRLLKGLILMFETRLEDPQVKFLQMNEDRQKFLVEVSGKLALTHDMSSVIFTISVDKNP